MSIISIKRGIECTSGLMYERNEKEEKGISILKKTIRTVNGASNAPDSGKGAKSNPNIQETQFSALSEDFSKLVIKYNLKFLNILDFELVSEEEENFKENLINFVSSTDDFVKLSQNRISRAILNRIVSAIPAWRNRTIALSIDTELNIKEFNKEEQKIQEKKYLFKNVDLMGKNTFNKNTVDVITPFEKKEFEEIAERIENSLFNKSEPLVMEVKYILDMGTDKVEVYPSELMTDTDGKHLYHINNIAAITSQKIQNALRKYDNFTTDKEISIGEWGADLSTMKAYRNERKQNEKNKNIKTRSFYFYKDLLNTKPIEEFIALLDVEELIYFQGILIKGGLFGEEKKAEKEKTDKKAENK